MERERGDNGAKRIPDYRNMINAWDLLWLWCLVLLIVFMIGGCAHAEGTYTYCVGACGKIEVEKRESPNKPEDFRKGSENGS